MFCEYCENEAVRDDAELGAVCSECLEAAEQTFEETGKYVVEYGVDWDVERDARDGY